MDDRPADGEVDAIAKLRAEFDDYRSTTNARVNRRPVGCIEESLVVRADTLALNGQTVSRDTYLVLWQWAQDNGLVVANLFTAGDGSTTFGLPNLSGRTGVGVGTLGADTYTLGQTVGSATRVLTTGNLPAHDHSVAVANHATHDHNAAVANHTTHDHNAAVANHATHDHNASVAAHTTHTHGFTTDTEPAHGGHVGAGTSPNADGAAQSTYTLALGGHSHAGTTGSGGPTTHSVTESLAGPTTHSVTESLAGPTTHSVTETLAGPTTHTVTETSVGSGTAVDIRQPGVGLHWIVWT